MDNRTLKRLLKLDAEKKELEKKLEKVKETRKEVEGRLLTQFEKAGMRSANVDGKTVYIHKQLWASPKDGRTAVCDALRELGMGDEYVVENFNTNSLSAYVRELDAQEEELPEKLSAVIDVVAKFALRVRKA